MRNSDDSSEKPGEFGDVNEYSVPGSDSDSDSDARTYTVREILLPGTRRPTWAATDERGQDFSLDRALSDFSDIVSDYSITFDVKIRRLLVMTTAHLRLRGGVLLQIHGGECEVVAAHAAAQETEDPLLLKQGLRLPLSDLCCGRTIREAGPYAVESVREQYPEAEYRYYDAYIGCPIYVNEQLYGTLSFISGERRLESFTDSEKLFVKMTARYVGNEIGRQQTRDALTYRIEFEKLLNIISTNFINLPVEEVDHGIQEALAKIAQFADVDLSYIFVFKDDCRRMDISHCWFTDDFTPQFRVKDIPVEKYQWAMEQILRREVVYIPDFDELPEQASTVQRFCRAQGIQSAIMVPMVYSGATIGLVGFASCRTRKHFDRHVCQLLEMVGCMLASAVEYKRAQERLRCLEAQVRHAQKLESLGILAGGIAHDFNNMLMGILGNAGIALNQLPYKSPARLSLRRIEKISQHAADLTNQLLAYSGKGKFFVEVLNLSAVVDDMVDLLDTAISKKHTVRYNFANDLPAIEGDAAQISQVIMNLITNASEAIGDRKGVITVSTGLVAVNKEYLLDTYLSGDTPEGVYTYLRVADSGCGMDDETLSKIFDPFFTTKFTGRGLGLAAVLGIVRAHNGTLKVHSIPDEGTVITVLFPCSERQELVARQRSTPKVVPLRSGGTVLVVDDEEAVRSVVAQTLKTAGFAVLCAEDGATALQLYLEHAATLDAVILDMSMPDMDGGEVFRRMQQLPGAAKVLLTSGYSEQEFEGSFAGERFGGFLQKPYLPQTLLSKLGEILEDEEVHAAVEA
ncbi:MAG: response regulator [Bdellovibrionales bacterium]|nr:response regulator [Bdellovibrionales bacterium]